jgi:hypothetical protein
MNERVKALAQQAGESIPEFHFGDWNIPNEFIQKFSELIVQECANVADENYIHRGSRTCGLAIRLHFGVEE